MGGGRHHGREEDQVAVPEDGQQAGGVAGGGDGEHHAGQRVLQRPAGGQHDGQQCQCFLSLPTQMKKGEKAVGCDASYVAIPIFFTCDRIIDVNMKNLNY